MSSITPKSKPCPVLALCGLHGHRQVFALHHHDGCVDVGISHAVTWDPVTLPVQSISRDVLREKYLRPGEHHVDDVYARVARALASVEPTPLRDDMEQRFLANLHAGAIGAGRIMSAAGTDSQATLINCFVQPVGDGLQGVDDDGYPGIRQALREAAETLRCGGGVGYDFSRIRPRGARVSGIATDAWGPGPVIDLFDRSGAEEAPGRPRLRPHRRL